MTASSPRYVSDELSSRSAKSLAFAKAPARANVGPVGGDAGHRAHRPTEYEHLCAGTLHFSHSVLTSQRKSVTADVRDDGASRALSVRNQSLCDALINLEPLRA